MDDRRADAALPRSRFARHPARSTSSARLTVRLDDGPTSELDVDPDARIYSSARSPSPPGRTGSRFIQWCRQRRADAVIGNGDRACAVDRRRHMGMDQRHEVASAYRRFWAGVGERFPDLGGAASTRYYAANEERLFAEHCRRSPDCASSRPICGTKRRTRASSRGRRAAARAPSASTSPNRPCARRDAAFTGAPSPLRAAAADVRGAAVSRRELRRDLLDGHDRALRRDRAGRARDGARAQARRPRDHRRAEPARSVSAAAARDGDAGGRPLRLRLREVLLAARAARDAANAPASRSIAETAILFIPGWLRIARPGVPLVVPAACRSLTGAMVRAVRVARSARPGGAAPRLSAGDRRGQTATVGGLGAFRSTAARRVVAAPRQPMARRHRRQRHERHRDEHAGNPVQFRARQHRENDHQRMQVDVAADQARINNVVFDNAQRRSGNGRPDREHRVVQRRDRHRDARQPPTVQSAARPRARRR